MDISNIIFKDYFKFKKIILNGEFKYFCSDDYFDYFRSANPLQSKKILANRIKKRDKLVCNIPILQAHYVTNYDLDNI